MSLTKISNNSLSAISTLPASIPTGALTLLSTQTASSSASIEFTSGIDSTYDSYIFKFIDIHPATDNVYFGFQVDTGTNTNWNQTITSTSFIAQHDESNTTTELGYAAGSDQAQGTGLEPLIFLQGADVDQQCSGTLRIFNPSSSVFVKHFIARGNGTRFNDYSRENFQAGYINTTTPITRVQFKISTGNIDDGIIKMYGVS